MHSYNFRVWTCLFFVYCLISTLCCAQGLTLSLSSGSANRGGSTTLNLSLNAAAGGQPASLEWTLNYSATDFSSAGVAVGPAAAQASKSVSCENQTGSLRCILWGLSSGSVSDGVVATVSLNVSPSTSNTSSAVQILSPAAANPSAAAISASASGGTVTIVQAPGLNGFSCNPILITPPIVSTCTVDLTSAAGSGGTTIKIGRAS